jgi:hypothetical protein
MAIAALADTDMLRGAAISTHMTAPVRYGAIRSLAQLSALPETALDELDQLLDRIENAAARRNLYVHNTWGRDPRTDAVFIFRTTARSELSIQSVNVDMEALRSDAKEIYDAGMALIDFLARCGLRPDKDPKLPPNFHARSRKARKKRS